MYDKSLREQLGANLQAVHERIAQAAAGQHVRLVCVTKYAREAWLPLLLDAGATELGENLLPQAAERFAALSNAGYKFQRHLIGPLQSRKVPQVPGAFDCLQALDRMKIAEALESELTFRGLTLDVLLQVNIAGEPGKHGFAEAEALPACEEIIVRLPHLRLRGLMLIPPGPESYSGTREFERGSRACFRQTRALFDRIRKDYAGAVEMDTLSMGMSQDFVWAVEEGANMVRVGSVLFSGLEG